MTLHPDDLKVDRFATVGEAGSTIATTVPYSLLGSCYGCPPETITICPGTYAA
jgi:hypothetical protein